MLVVEIALGIVLAVALLAFLPTIFSVSIWIVVGSIIIGLIAVAVYYVFENPIASLLWAVFAVAAYFIFRADSEGGAEEEKERRKNLGYDD